MATFREWARQVLGGEVVEVQTGVAVRFTGTQYEVNMEHHLVELVRMKFDYQVKECRILLQILELAGADITPVLVKERYTAAAELFGMGLEWRSPSPIVERAVGQIAEVEILTAEENEDGQASMPEGAHD